MALLNKLKSILGIGGGRDEGDRQPETSVTVEREADTSEAVADEEPVAAGTDATASTGSMTDSSADAEQAAEPGEAAAPPTEPDDEDREVGAVIDEAEPSADSDEATDADESVAAGTDAAASTESLTDSEGGADGAAEPGEAAGPPAGSADGDDPVEDDEHSNDAEPPGEPVETIKGIGPAYADRLGDAGIDSIADLAGADAETVGEAIGVSPKRVADWIDRAADR